MEPPCRLATRPTDAATNGPPPSVTPSTAPRRRTFPARRRSASVVLPARGARERHDPPHQRSALHRYTVSRRRCIADRHNRIARPGACPSYRAGLPHAFQPSASTERYRHRSAQRGASVLNHPTAQVVAKIWFVSSVPSPSDGTSDESFNSAMKSFIIGARAMRKACGPRMSVKT